MSINKTRSGKEHLINLELPYNDLKTILGITDKSTPALCHGSNKRKSMSNIKSNTIHDCTNSTTRKTDKVNENLSQVIARLINDHSEEIRMSKVTFVKATPDTAQQNWELLKEYDFNLEKIRNETKK